MTEIDDDVHEVVTKIIDIFLEDANEFLLRAKDTLGIKITAEGSSRSPEKDKIRTTASKMVSNMVNKIRRGRGVDICAECENLLRRYKDADRKIRNVLEETLSSQEMLLEQGVQVHRRLQSCRLHNESLRKARKASFERLMNWMADISSAETDIQATINYLAHVKVLEERDSQNDLVGLIGHKEKLQQKKKKEIERDESRGITETALSKRLQMITTCRERVDEFFTKEIESMTRIELILGILKDTEKAMRASLSDIVPGGQVDTFLASKVADSGQAYDHSMCNDCETAANMCQEFIDLMSVNHARAKTFTEQLQRCLMVSTQLQAVESYEKSLAGCGDDGKPPLLRSHSDGKLSPDS